MPPYFREFAVDGNAYKLKYRKRVATDHPDKAVFEASVEPMGRAGESGVVVVKFSYSYCQDAHRLLAEISLATHLLYGEKVESIGMCVVVMDLVAGRYAKVLCQDQRFTGELRTAIQILHDAGFVHGDLREPNILVAGSGDMKIIDFDWCGKEGEVCYP
jgi:serine/threonine protein kinase